VNCQFGTPGGHITNLSLSRLPGEWAWAGMLTSTYNQ
jgi:hypothetical protein